MTEVTAALLRSIPLPRHQDGEDKDQRGRVLVVAGSVGVPGAALLAGLAALRAGAGKLQIATCASVAPHLAMAVPEALVVGLTETPEGGISAAEASRLAELACRVDAVLAGPGMLEDESCRLLVLRLLEQVDGPALVLDAAALAGLAANREALARHRGRVIITPHAGEMAGMMELEKQAVQAAPQEVAQRTAARLGVVVALKGGCTRIATHDGTAWWCAQGNVGLATSGSGDTLAGIITGLLARGAPATDATLWGVYLHGEAGQRLARKVGPVGFLARELLAEIPGIMAELSR